MYKVRGWTIEGDKASALSGETQASILSAHHPGQAPAGFRWVRGTVSRGVFQGLYQIRYRTRQAALEDAVKAWPGFAVKAVKVP